MAVPHEFQVTVVHDFLTDNMTEYISSSNVSPVKNENFLIANGGQNKLWGNVNKI